MIWGERHPYWRRASDYPPVDEEVIALAGKHEEVCFAHIVNKDVAKDFDGWNIPDVRYWIPMPQFKYDTFN